MSLDVYCFTQLSIEEADVYIEKIKKEHSEIFQDKYRIFNARELDPIKREIAEEDFNLKNIRAWFYAPEWNKQFEGDTSDIAKIIYDTFGGKEKVTVMFGMDCIIEPK